MKTIELVKGKDGVYREGKTEPKQAVFRSSGPRVNTIRNKRSQKNPIEQVLETLNDTLEEVGIEALNELTRGFFK
jgi:hypothetical protein